MPAGRTLRQAEMAVNLLIASLSVFFAAGIAAVLLVARRLPQPTSIPWSLWLATVCLLATSFTLHRACRAVRRERQTAFRAWIAAALVLAVGFCAAQSFGMWDLCSRHLAVRTQGQTWILLFVLVGLHAAHVFVGLGILGVVSIRAWGGRFDHEYHLGLTLTARYWHFLDAVWLAVLGTCALLLR